MPSVEAVSLAGTSIFLEDCETIGSMMAKIAIAHQRVATDVAVIDPASGKRLAPDMDIQQPKLNFIILDEEKVEDQAEVLCLNLRLHAEQNDLSTCAMAVRELKELDCLTDAEDELHRIVVWKRGNWEVATHMLLRLGIPESITLSNVLRRGCLDGVKAIISSQPPTDDKAINDSSFQSRTLTLSKNLTTVKNTV